jgi:hypothetical protein
MPELTPHSIHGPVEEGFGGTYKRADELTSRLSMDGNAALQSKTALGELR